MTRSPCREHSPACRCRNVPARSRFRRTAEVAGAVARDRGGACSVRPDYFMEGVIGRFFEYGLPFVCRRGLASVAVTLTPTPSARARRVTPWAGLPVVRSRLPVLDVGYGKLLDRALRQRPLTLVIAFTIPVGALRSESRWSSPAGSTEASSRHVEPSQGAMSASNGGCSHRRDAPCPVCPPFVSVGAGVAAS